MKETAFNPITLEKKILQKWEKDGVEESLRSRKGKKSFFLLDGPPYLNAKPHIGHMQGKTIKDVILRLKRMQGFTVYDQAGFDTHGLPNEVKTEEELGFSSKKDILKFGVANFISLCKKRAVTSESDWKRAMKRWAIWQDFEHPYLTFHTPYIESIWWLIKQAQEQNLLYFAQKPIHWCSRCETSLAGYEVTDTYRKVTDFAITVRFPLLNEKNTSILIWTTTPWTLPANIVALVHPDLTYVYADIGSETVILAEELLPSVLKNHTYTITKKMKGTELVGLKYLFPLLENIPEQKALEKKYPIHQIYPAPELVTTETGTGIVHAASGHGEEDYEVTRKFNIPVFSPVSSEGKFTEGTWKGLSVFDANQPIVTLLEENGKLFDQEKITHDYPHCWRCKTKLIQRATGQWFISIEPLKKKMIAENEKVRWTPPWAQERFRKWLKGAKDWCISRQRYWGTPLPIWINEKTGKYEVIGSIEELRKKDPKNVQKNFDPHIPSIDTVTWTDAHGNKFRRVPDICDVWMDSGTASFASLHYPFNKTLFAEKFPANFITESSDQIRGWFYTLMVCGVLGFKRSAFSEVMFQQHVLDAKGRKMSKSEGNVIDPMDVAEQYGADAGRFYLLYVAPAWEHSKFNVNEVKSEIFRIFSVLWNSAKLLSIKKTGKKTEEKRWEDTWFRERTDHVIKLVTDACESRHFHHAARELERYILIDLSRTYIKLARERLKNGDEYAHKTLERAIETTVLLLAPISPFISDAIWQDVLKRKGSVHQQKYPLTKKTSFEIDDAMNDMKEVAEAVAKERQKQNTPMRWPLSSLTVAIEDHKNMDENVLKLLTNVKTITWKEPKTRLEGTPNFKKIGPLFGKETDNIAAIIKKLSRDDLKKLLGGKTISIGKIKLSPELLEIKESKSADDSGIPLSFGSISLDTTLTPELREEAWTSEVIRAIQQRRKEMGLNINQEISLNLYGSDAQILKKFESSWQKRVNAKRIAYTQTGKGEKSVKKIKKSLTFTVTLLP